MYGLAVVYYGFGWPRVCTGFAVVLSVLFYRGRVDKTSSFTNLSCLMAPSSMMIVDVILKQVSILLLRFVPSPAVRTLV